jgi:hypothetical protein
MEWGKKEGKEGREGRKKGEEKEIQYWTLFFWSYDPYSGTTPSPPPPPEDIALWDRCTHLTQGQPRHRLHIAAV